VANANQRITVTREEKEKRKQQQLRRGKESVREVGRSKDALNMEQTTKLEGLCTRARTGGAWLKARYLSLEVAFGEGRSLRKEGTKLELCYLRRRNGEER